MEDALAEQNRLLQEHPSSSYDEENPASQFITEQAIQLGHAMMLEAIYEVFFESFDWNKLNYDVLRRNAIDPVNPDVTIDQQASFERLKDYIRIGITIFQIRHLYISLLYLQSLRLVFSYL